MKAQSQRTPSGPLKVQACFLRSPPSRECDGTHSTVRFTQNRTHCCGYYFKSRSESCSLTLLCLLLMLDQRVKISEPLSGIFHSTLMKQSDLSELLVLLPATALPFEGAFTED